MSAFDPRRSWPHYSVVPLAIRTLFYQQFELSELQRYKIIVHICAPGGSMSNTAASQIDRPEEEVLTYEASDEALESAAVTGRKQAAHYTLVCTFFHYCPI
jgi:hypothetical protein